LADDASLGVRLPPGELRAAVEQIQRLAPRAYVILAGSAGTGELTRSSGGDRLSDLEIAVSGWLRALRAARRVRASSDVETFWVAPWRLRFGLRRNSGAPRPNVFAFDLARMPRYGRAPRLSEPVKVWQPDELTRREAVSLILNRLAESLEVVTPYSRVKVAIACGDALLVAAGRYDTGYGSRARRFEELSTPISPASRQLIQAAYRSKLAAELERVSPRQLRAVVEEVLRTIAPELDRRESRAYPVLALLWEEDAAAAGWSPLLRLLDRNSLRARAIARLGYRQSRRLFRAYRYPQAAVYADLLRAVAGEGDDLSNSLRAWRAVC
jgi:hypothetical protein